MAVWRGKVMMDLPPGCPIQEHSAGVPKVGCLGILVLRHGSPCHQCALFCWFELHEIVGLNKCMLIFTALNSPSLKPNELNTRAVNWGKFDEMKKACDEVLAKVNPESVTQLHSTPGKHPTLNGNVINSEDPVFKVKALYRRAQARLGPASAVDTDREAAIQVGSFRGPLCRIRTLLAFPTSTTSDMPSVTVLTRTCWQQPNLHQETKRCEGAGIRLTCMELWMSLNFASCSYTWKTESGKANIQRRCRCAKSIILYSLATRRKTIKYTGFGMQVVFLLWAFLRWSDLMTKKWPTQYVWQTAYSACHFDNASLRNCPGTSIQLFEFSLSHSKSIFCLKYRIILECRTGWPQHVQGEKFAGEASRW